MENLIPEIPFTEEEQKQLNLKLWGLVKSEAFRILGGDSTSMSVENAKALTESLMFTLGIVLRRGVSKWEILNGSMTHLTALGQEILETETEETKQAWEKLAGSLPKVQNVYFSDTCANLGGFFKKYDIFTRAHEVPVCIDYWPLCPVPESLKGVEYVAEYIRRLQAECDFLSCFAKERILQLYRNRFPSYEDDFFNLCEPVLECTVMEVLARKEIGALEITAEEGNKALSCLREASKEELEAIAARAVSEVCLQIGQEEHTEYFAAGIRGFLCRMLLRFGDPDRETKEQFAPVRFENAAPEDAEEIFSLYRKAAASAFSAWDDEYPGEREIRADLAAECLFCLRDKEQIIACASVEAVKELDHLTCWDYKEKTAEIARVCVHPKHQGKGNAARMVSKLETMLAEKGVTAVHLLAAKKNLPACQTYRKLGYQCRGTIFMYGTVFFTFEKAIDKNRTDDGKGEHL